jgi:hypothetical protein
VHGAAHHATAERPGTDPFLARPHLREAVFAHARICHARQQALVNTGQNSVPMPAHSRAAQSDTHMEHSASEALQQRRIIRDAACTPWRRQKARQVGGMASRLCMRTRIADCKGRSD